MPPDIRPRIAYVISAVSTDNTGMGGHYRSVLALAERMGEEGQMVTVFTLGDIFPPPFEAAKIPVKYVFFSGAFSYLKKFQESIARFSPTHIHAFDNKSYFFARLAARASGIPVFLTRPGGANRNTFFPFCNDIIGFSDENLEHLKKRKNLKKSRFHLIPNRVSTPASDLGKIERLKQLIKKNDDELVVLRVCRIGHYYRQSIHQTIALTRRLRAEGMNARALIVGFIQDQEVFDELEKSDEPLLTMVTDADFTTQAAAIVDIGDLVVGTGRSFMEAALRKRLCLTPMKAGTLPALVSGSNFDALATTNFSERNVIQDFDETENFERLMTLVSNPEARETHAERMKQLVDTRFGVGGAVERHLSIYMSRTGYQGASLADYVGNFAGVFRFYAPLVARRPLKHFRF